MVTYLGDTVTMAFKYILATNYVKTTIKHTYRSAISKQSPVIAVFRGSYLAV